MALCHTPEPCKVQPLAAGSASRWILRRGDNGPATAGPAAGGPRPPSGRPREVGQFIRQRPSMVDSSAAADSEQQLISIRKCGADGLAEMTGRKRASLSLDVADLRPVSPEFPTIVPYSPSSLCGSEHHTVSPGDSRANFTWERPSGVNMLFIADMTDAEALINVSDESDDDDLVGDDDNEYIPDHLAFQHCGTTTAASSTEHTYGYTCTTTATNLSEESRDGSETPNGFAAAARGYRRVAPDMLLPPAGVRDA
eukprot:TRINITY_DN9260_c0_g1_i1.p1 TRINITY_DN9260_c0_g1~~TRINITY_DN9260_c0_g1_i1.p1  ORF type:complete len:254 (+),score=56.09 TRINITY_DN9260_c0_g1_i1:229-990(+)